MALARDFHRVLDSLRMGGERRQGNDARSSKVPSRFRGSNTANTLTHHATDVVVVKVDESLGIVTRFPLIEERLGETDAELDVVAATTPAELAPCIRRVALFCFTRVTAALVVLSFGAVARDSVHDACADDCMDEGCLPVHWHLVVFAEGLCV